MISRAFVEAIMDETHVSVRIPRLNKISGAVGSTPSSELASACICTLPGCKPRLRPGDIVLVGYEDDDDGSPIVLGLLFQPQMQSTSDVVLDSVKVKVNAELSENTQIGKLNKEVFNMLEGARDNIQIQLDKQNVIQTTAQNLIDDLIEKVNHMEAQGQAKTVAYYGKTNPKDLSPGTEGQLYIYIED